MGTLSFEFAGLLFASVLKRNTDHLGSEDTTQRNQCP
jgi:hypothetical protein